MKGSKLTSYIMSPKGNIKTEQVVHSMLTVFPISPHNTPYSKSLAEERALLSFLSAAEAELTAQTKPQMNKGPGGTRHVAAQPWSLLPFCSSSLNWYYSTLQKSRRIP